MLTKFFRSKPWRNLFGGSAFQKSRVAGSHLILFVHGLSGSAIGSWGGMLSIVAGDADLTEYSFDCYAFPTTLIKLPLSGRTSGVREISNGLRTFLRAHHPNINSLTLVGHSLGGIVIRQFLLEECKAGRGEATSAILYAVPNTGAAIAGIGNFFSFRHKHLKQLCSGSDFLEGLNIDWVSNSIEQKCPIEFIVGGQDEVVTPESASCIIGAQNVKTLIDYGHKAIIKPKTKSDIRYLVLKDFILRYSPYNETGKTIDTAVSKLELVHNGGARPADVLFDIYSRRSEPYYVVRQIDGIIAKASLGAHIWISGPSGVGKTAALKRLAETSDWRLCHIMLGSFQDRTADQLLREVCVELYERGGVLDVVVPRDTEISALLPHFRRAIAALPTADLTAIFIEEIPLPPGDQYSRFLKSIYHLALEVGGESSKIVWLYSSINSPKKDVPSGIPKLHERIQFIEIDIWTKEDLLSLVNLVAGSLKPDMTDAEKMLLVENANGSPRFVKAVFRNNRNQGGVAPLQEVISLIKAESV